LNIEPKFEDFMSEDLCERTGYGWSRKALQGEIDRLGQELRDGLGLEIAELDARGSKFFKEVYINPARVPPMVSELSVINEIGA
jgi:hypothetical protein